MVRYADIGLVGLGVMGRNLALNFRDKGFSVAGFDIDSSKVKALNTDAMERRFEGYGSVEDFVSALKTPCAILMLVPAGKPVDMAIKDFLPHLNPGDLIIDAGNSHFSDTDRRIEYVSEKGIHFMGVGVSGGEKGARYGPSIMPGGNKEAYEQVRPLFEAAAAQVNGDPCVAYLGSGSAGHYVKMVHNGIEYGIMQLIGETYDIMKRGLQFDAERLHQVYEEWNQGELESYLVQITSGIFLQRDKKTSLPLIDRILDEAKQKGTGKWASQDSMDLGIPLSTMDTAVVMRHLSALRHDRQQGASIFGECGSFEDKSEVQVEDLRNALYACTIMTYAQGMALLSAASKHYQYDVPLSDVARIWRGGCIIRAAVLEKIRSAFEKRPDLSNLMFDESLGKKINECQGSLRKLVRSATAVGIPIPAFAASLSYFDSFRSSWLPANLIQAQRDYFGSHTYERIDEPGAFHTEWGQPER
ncbi:NADP-dependent phosphogluconate dehydrogenase [Desulfomonile tiedjei]|uniref:6-phosphogluconate dehydrogenase, decarboxylating n=1 Tax=Desulfomonile tiedjei (strain ATCC 49306 / DSM 6799 / DCB-1) TaxID=706587 RepID=I4C5G6_DESTA|nr:NADP-dependent phosphogluconate dehydrogenase [Desulfomonile tiedjei]AFM24807.1 6-phosphogluconate dehydrogenase, decarboxylating [Desulfomonile tiedjei DSM 6799]